MKHRVFVYGTLKRGFRLHFYLESGKFLGEGFIEGYEMYIVDWYPAVIKGKGKVFGEIYEVDDKTLKLLDEIEDEGLLYKRVKEKVYTGKGIVEAFIYVYLKDVSDLRKIKTGKFS